MSLSHQMLVRCAAVTGLTFTTELLFEVLPCWNMKMMIKALATLVDANVFDCFRNGKELRTALKHNAASCKVNHRSLSLRPGLGIGECAREPLPHALAADPTWARAERCVPASAARDEGEELHELESEVIECHVIRFCRPVMQKTAYELWLKAERRAMHLKCARFLEEDAHRCDHCRSGDFVPYHHFTVDIRLNTLDVDTIQKMAKSHGYKSKYASGLARPLCLGPGVGLDPEGFKSPKAWVLRMAEDLCRIDGGRGGGHVSTECTRNSLAVTLTESLRSGLWQNGVHRAQRKISRGMKLTRLNSHQGWSPRAGVGLTC